jgi:hemoglobin
MRNWSSGSSTSSRTDPISPPAIPDRYPAVTEAAISAFVDAFYAKVRADSALGPVFLAAIADEAWPEHLAKIRRFWSSVMLGSRRYSGDPVGVHRAVAGIERALFPRWLALFGETAGELFEPEAAAQLTGKAHRIAESLQLAIFHRLGGPPQGLPPRPAR